MSKQDRQGVRLPSDLERKYNFGRTFSDQRQKSTRQEEQIASLSNELLSFMDSTRIALADLDERITQEEEKTEGLPLMEESLSELTERVEAVELAIEELLDRVIALESVTKE